VQKYGLKQRHMDYFDQPVGCFDINRYQRL